jgi:hypothetical protein
VWEVCKITSVATADIPLGIVKAAEKNADWADPAIFGTLPTKDRPVVLIPRTAESEPYDMLLMLYRESNVPLFVAIDVETLHGTTDTPANMHQATETPSSDQKRTTDYFLSCQDDIHAFPIRGKKKLHKGTQTEREYNFDFVYTSYTTRRWNSTPKKFRARSYKEKV